MVKIQYFKSVFCTLKSFNIFVNIFLVFNENQRNPASCVTWKCWSADFKISLSICDSQQKVKNKVHYLFLQFNFTIWSFHLDDWTESYELCEQFKSILLRKRITSISFEEKSNVYEEKTKQFEEKSVEIWKVIWKTFIFPFTDISYLLSNV